MVEENTIPPTITIYAGVDGHLITITGPLSKEQRDDMQAVLVTADNGNKTLPSYHFKPASDLAGEVVFKKGWQDINLPPTTFFHY